MGTKKILGIVLLIMGLIVVILSLIADTINLGGSPTFGLYQISGTVAGIIAVVAGIILLRKK